MLGCHLLLRVECGWLCALKQPLVPIQSLAHVHMLFHLDSLLLCYLLRICNTLIWYYQFGRRCLIEHLLSEVLETTCIGHEGRELAVVAAAFTKYHGLMACTPACRDTHIVIMQVQNTRVCLGLVS